MIVMVREAAVLGGPAADATRPPRAPLPEARFEALYRAAARPLWAYVAKISGDASLADDIVQRAFLQLLSTPVEDQGDERLRAFVFAIATNLVRDHWRQNRRRPVADVHEAAHEGSQREIAMRRDMQRVFEQLKPQERMMLWLAHVEESSHEEIASAVGVRAGSVKVLLYRARRKLGSLLRKRGITPEGIR